jgi:hypothetical protein
MDACQARKVDEAEIEIFWPQLACMRHAYQEHYDRSGQRTVFFLENLRQIPA